MNGTALAVCFPGSDARTIQRAGMAADKFGLAQLWAGDPRASAPNSDENYILPALAATAAATKYVRLGAFIQLGPTAQTMRVAEDIAIVDATSNGRMEVGLLVPPATARASWEQAASALLGAYHHWPALNGETYSVTPPLQQSWLPRVLVGGSQELAVRLGAGRAVWPGDPKPAESSIVCRVSLFFDFSAGVCSMLAQDPVAFVLDLRSLVDAAGAHQVIAVLSRKEDLELDLHALGAVVSPGIRCAREECEQLTRDGWTWVTENSRLHHSPYERASR
jgi:hypothetical protein